MKFDAVPGAFFGAVPPPKGGTSYEVGNLRYCRFAPPQ
jgi:hypothetical protein